MNQGKKTGAAEAGLEALGGLGKVSMLRPKPETDIRNPKLETRIPTLKTRNPKPEILSRKAGVWGGDNEGLDAAPEI